MVSTYISQFRRVNEEEVRPNYRRLFWPPWQIPTNLWCQTHSPTVPPLLLDKLQPSSSSPVTRICTKSFAETRSDDKSADFQSVFRPTSTSHSHAPMSNSKPILPSLYPSPSLPPSRVHVASNFLKRFWLGQTATACCHLLGLIPVSIGDHEPYLHVQSIPLDAGYNFQPSPAVVLAQKLQQNPSDTLPFSRRHQLFFHH